MMENCDRLLKWVMVGVVSLFICYVISFLYHIHLAYPSTYYTTEFKELSDTIKASLTSGNDSLMTIYLSKIDTLTQEAISKVDHYETSVDLMIDKANNWIGFWVGILSILLAISTILQVWRNYQSKVSLDSKIKEIEGSWKKYEEVNREKLDEKLNEVERIGKELQQTIAESRILTIANCLSNCPDPAILSQSDKHRRYAKFYLAKLYSAYEDYVSIVSWLLTDRKHRDREFIYEQEDYLRCTDRVVSVLHTINSNVSKVLVLFANVDQYLELYQFTTVITECSEKLMNKGLCRDDLIESLNKISLAFNQWIKTMDNPV